MPRDDLADGPGRRGLLVLGALLVVIPACATVHPDEMDTALDDLREEMRQQNEETEERLGARLDEMEGRMEQRMDNLEQALTALQDDFDVAVERFEEAIRFNAPVHFAFDDATVQQEFEPILDRFAEVLSGYYDNALITVEGFTDPAGSPDYNLRLGQERAEAVMEYLASAGIPSDRMRAVSYGEAEDRQVAPGAQGPGEQGWENRRVAMVVDFRPDEAEPIANGGTDR